MSKKIAVVILNWNGKSFIEQFLPSVTKYSEDIANVVIADNASTDDSISFLKEHYPQLRLIEFDKNYGFAGGYNRALAQISEEFTVLLNSDVEVTENWLSPILQLMENDNTIGACQPKIKDYNNKNFFEYAGAAGGFIDKYGYPFCQGRIFNHLEEDKGQYDENKEIFWASGAAMFVRTNSFKEAGGLDEFFFAHMEEIDLCWRMQNLGHKIMYCADSTVYHVGGGTLNKTKPQKTFLNYRNSLLMLHKNLTKGERFNKILTRLILDGISGLKLVFEGKFNHMLAIFKAHFSFYGALKQNKTKRLSNSNKAIKGMINKSIVQLHFLKKVNYFTQIGK